MLHDRGSKYSLANMANLSIKPGQDDNSRPDRTASACERFLRSAILLPDGGFLGWQIDTKTFSNAVFSSFGAKVTMEDFNWIFHQCAVTSPLTSEWMADLYTGGRKVYRLSSVTGSARDIDLPGQRTDYLSDDIYDYNELPSRHFSYDRALFDDLFEMLAEANAVIRMVAGGTIDSAKGHGMVFISLPGEMTLRMRSMLSFAFPHMAADEVMAPPEGAEETEPLPDDCFLACLTKILTVLTGRKAGKEPLVEMEPEDFITAEDALIVEDDEEVDVGDEETKASVAASITIEELDLSVRAYNCLKRAGLHTVEDLQKLSDDELAHIRNIGRKNVEEIKQKLALLQDLTGTAPVQPTNYMAMLTEMVGLADVKEQVKKFAAFAKMRQDIAQNGKDHIPVALNMEFVGNPGTAKTTVARIVAGILCEIGLLSSPELVEVGRADLVARYEGQTASKVKDVFQKAKGKLLFIDEAYSLVENWEGEYGDEAINTIVQEMENNREEIIAIFAGYPDKDGGFLFQEPRAQVPGSLPYQLP